MYLRRFYFIILVYANLKMEYDTKDKTFWKRKGNDMKVLLGAVNAKYIHSNLAVYCLKAYAEKYGDTSDEISIGEYTINQQLDGISTKGSRTCSVCPAISGILLMLKRSAGRSRK